MAACNELQIIHSYVTTPSIKVETVAPQTIKMEDLSQSTSALLDVPSASTPKGERSVKKRKSWGQVLPEPKTNLPPRKRAKTADEKEQRRIERVKRNRLAAHNSRERKRQEVEALSDRNAQLEHQMRLMQQQLDTFRSLYPEANIPVLPAFKYETPIPDFESTPSAISLHPILEEMSTPNQLPFSSPDSLLSTIDSPVDTAPSTPGSSMDETDRTQQSAVSVGFFPINLGGDGGNAKVPGSATFDHCFQFPDPQEDGLFDFALFPNDTDSFFTESFDSTVSREVPAGVDKVENTETVGASFFDLQPGAGALFESCDAQAIATEIVGN